MYKKKVKKAEPTEQEKLEMRVKAATSRVMDLIEMHTLAKMPVTSDGLFQAIMGGMQHPDVQPETEEEQRAKGRKAIAADHDLDDPVAPSCVFIYVPYAQKEKAKRLGAKWHVHRRMWYIPKGLTISRFKSWLEPNQAWLDCQQAHDLKRKRAERKADARWADARWFASQEADEDYDEEDDEYDDGEVEDVYFAAAKAKDALAEAEDDDEADEADVEDAAPPSSHSTDDPRTKSWPAGAKRAASSGKTYRLEAKEPVFINVQGSGDWNGFSGIGRVALGGGGGPGTEGCGNGSGGNGSGGNGSGGARRGRALGLGGNGSGGNSSGGAGGPGTVGGSRY